MTSSRERLLHGSIIAFAGFALGGLFSYVLRIVIARNLPVEEVGLFSSALSLIIMITLFQRIGIELSLVRYISLWKERSEYGRIYCAIKGVVIYSVVWGVIFAAILAGASSSLGAHYFKEPRAAAVVVVLSALLFLLILEDIPRRIFQGFGNMAWFSLLEAGKALMLVIFVGGGFLFFSSLWVPVIAYISATFVVGIVGVLGVLRLYPVIVRSRGHLRGTFREVFVYGLPLIFFVIGNKSIETVDLLMLTYFSSLEQVGIYSVVLPTAAITLFFFRPVAVMIMPISTGLWERNLKGELREMANITQRYMVLLMVPLIALISVNSKWVITLLFGPDYSSGYRALQIILSCIIFYGLAHINISVLTSIGASRQAGWVMVYATIFNLVMNLALIPMWGMLGAAISTALSYLLAWVLSHTYLRKNFEEVVLSRGFPWARILSLLLIAGIISWKISWIIDTSWQGAVMSTLFFLPAYVMVVVLLRLSSWGEMKAIFRMLLKKQAAGADPGERPGEMS